MPKLKIVWSIVYNYVHHRNSANPEVVPQDAKRHPIMLLKQYCYKKGLYLGVKKMGKRIKWMELVLIDSEGIRSTKGTVRQANLVVKNSRF